MKINKEQINFEIKNDSEENIVETVTLESTNSEKKSLIFKIKCSNVDIFKVDPIMGVVPFGEKQIIKIILKKSLYLKQTPQKVKFLVEFLELPEEQVNKDDANAVKDLCKQHRDQIQ